MTENDQDLSLLSSSSSMQEYRSSQTKEENYAVPRDSRLVESIKEITGYEFKDKDLLEEAFIHHSCDGPKSYERLEYIGDSILSFLISKEHYFLYPHLPPGDLTRLRAANVDKEKLARVSLKYELYKFLSHNKPLLGKQIEEFREAVKEYPLHSVGLVDPPKTLGDIVESLIGAIYIDSNSMDTTWQIVKNLLHPMITPATMEIHPVTKLLELCQKIGSKLTVVDHWKQKGEIEILVDDQLAGKAKYESKRTIALNRAAKNAHCNMVNVHMGNNTGSDH